MPRTLQVRPPAQFKRSGDDYRNIGISFRSRFLSGFFCLEAFADY
jgi:hypothetical protein